MPMAIRQRRRIRNGGLESEWIRFCAVDDSTSACSLKSQPQAFTFHLYHGDISTLKNVDVLIHEVSALLLIPSFHTD
ncbi:hypothetical protein RSAG8_13556, partial [Rhizoctonia solani AG-8 WAC10335]